MVLQLGLIKLGTKLGFLKLWKNINGESQNEQQGSNTTCKLKHDYKHIHSCSHINLITS